MNISELLTEISVLETINVNINSDNENGAQNDTEDGLQENSSLDEINSATITTTDNISKADQYLILTIRDKVPREQTLIKHLNRIYTNIMELDKRIETISTNINSLSDYMSNEYQTSQKKVLPKTILSSIQNSETMSASMRNGQLMDQQSDKFVKTYRKNDQIDTLPWVEKQKLELQLTLRTQYPFERSVYHVEIPKNPINQPRIPNEWKKEFRKQYKPVFYKLDEDDEIIYPFKSAIHFANKD